MTCISNLKVNPKVCFKGLLRVVIARQISKERKEVHVNHTVLILANWKRAKTCRPVQRRCAYGIMGLCTWYSMISFADHITYNDTYPVCI